MTHIKHIPILFLLLGCQAEPSVLRSAHAAPAVSGAASAVTTPGTAAPAAAATPGVIDESALDRKAQPCTDFYQFACGGWLARTEIPADRATWSRGFSEVQERNEALLRGILEDYAQGKPAQADAKEPNPYGKKMGDFYATCMDEQKAETASLATLKQELAEIDAGKDLAQTVARLHLSGVGVLFDFDSQQDFKDATQVIAVADQGGLGLPDRDYYLKDDAKSKEILKLYAEHVGKMLSLIGDGQAAAHAQTVLKIESALAKVSLSRTDRRDPHKIYHRLERAGLLAAAPRFGWERFFAGLGYPSVQAINVAVPEFFRGLNELLGSAAPADLRTYMRWHLVRRSAMFLGQRFVDESFRFKSSALTGEKQLLPRWKRCVEASERMLSEAVGRSFVHATFGDDGKARALEMIKGIEAAFDRNLPSLSWMDAATRAAALEKMHHIVNKIGFPDRWRNYDALQIDRQSYLGNTLRAAAFEARRQLDKIGKPVDRNEWLMPPSMVNAYYEPSMNEMVFPAGILQPPFFNRAAGQTTNFGAIGMVMGHELTHGFDDEGRQFDGAGNLRDWWAPAVGKAFTERAECVAKQYEAYPVLDSHLNGHLTLGENIGDIGGLKMAFLAWQAGRDQQRAQGVQAKVAGFTDEQQLFVSFAQSWCTKVRDESARMRLTVDPHSPPRYRVNGTVSDQPAFQAAFQCPAGSPMAPLQRCTVW